MAAKTEGSRNQVILPDLSKIILIEYITSQISPEERHLVDQSVLGEMNQKDIFAYFSSLQRDGILPETVDLQINPNDIRDSLYRPDGSSRPHRRGTIVSPYGR